jgi:hypothetical protein
VVCMDTLFAYIDHFRREKKTLSLPLFFFSVRRLFCCIIVVWVSYQTFLFLTSYARPGIRASFLCCERNSCGSSILRHFWVYVTAGSYVKFLVKWRQTCHIPIYAFLKAFDFQSRKQNRAEIFVYKNYKLHI